MKRFDYTKIPQGYYDEIFRGPEGLRKFWHYHKFESVLRFLPPLVKGNDKSILDVGCFAGTFLGTISKDIFSYQLGVDILPAQITYAESTYGTTWRKFINYNGKLELGISYKEKFDVITLIEVVEHLNVEEILNLFIELLDLLKPSGRIIITTPNYLSIWPVLEFLINNFAGVSYDEQHITKFSFYGMEKKMEGILREIPLKLEKKTTTHFLTPFIAPFSYELALKTSKIIPSSIWKNPFGSIILSSWVKC
jgi:2-polyprenyl-3-methyl-5-hydroxy-6-metoxy-1,4-benzoquinol methylase